MGNSLGCGCCCAGDDAKKDAYVDKYIKKWHVVTTKITKYDKKDFFLAKQDFENKTYKATKCNEILDEKARSLDM
jgi:DNA-binding transcriptional regulator GbsR (MarR family)